MIKDYKMILSQADKETGSTRGGGIKFRHLIDFYLRSGKDFFEQLRNVNASLILSSLQSKQMEPADPLIPQSDLMMTDVQSNDGLNEKLLKLMCLNQAIDKLNREVSVLTSVRDQIISVMDEEV